MRLLILGGTAEATALGHALATTGGVEATLSLAGRTRAPAPQPLPCRIGGFGGAEGLAAFLRRETVEAVVDATHPFAARITAQAHAACGAVGVPLAAFTRPPWQAAAGDRWHDVPTLDAAAAALGAAPRRIFLTVGRQGLAAFRAAPQHSYLVRTIDPPEPADLPPDATVLRARGPFTAADEAALMAAEGIDILVTKNSGGDAAKLVAARRRGLPVIVVARPSRPAGGPVLHDLDAVLAWIAARHRAAP